MIRVIVLTRNSLFGKGIESLLGQEMELEIVTSSEDLDSLEACIQECQPDVIIVNCDDPKDELTSAILCAVRERLDVRVIGLSLRDNSICVYRGEQKQIVQVEDLLHAIED
jgi:DNA-binding NarL/FixJ family response regulator